MGPTSKAFTDVHCKGEQHKDWLQYRKVMPEYFPRATPTGSTTLLAMMIPVNERPLLRAAASAGGAWAAATMGALAHLRLDQQLPATNQWLDVALELGVPHPNRG